jgi:hypothetical protein
VPAPSGPGIPDHLVDFLRRSLDSVEGLEMLFLLHGTREREWAAEEINAELRSSALAVQDRLDNLERRGLVRRQENGSYRFDERSPDAPLVAELALEFARRPFTIMNLILQNPTDRIRTFADAFRLKKEKEKENDG